MLFAHLPYARSPCWQISSPTYSSSSVTRSPRVRSITFAMRYVTMNAYPSAANAPTALARNLGMHVLP